MNSPTRLWVRCSNARRHPGALCQSSGFGRTPDSYKAYYCVVRC
jgi:hypothetical protein